MAVTIRTTIKADAPLTLAKLRDFTLALHEGGAPADHPVTVAAMHDEDDVLQVLCLMATLESDYEAEDG